MGSGWRSGRHCLHQSLFSESFVTYGVSAEQTSSTLASHYRHNKLQMQSAKLAVTPSFISNRLWVGGCAEPSTYRTNDHSAGTGARLLRRPCTSAFLNRIRPGSRTSDCQRIVSRVPRGLTIGLSRGTAFGVLGIWVVRRNTLRLTLIVVKSSLKSVTRRPSASPIRSPLPASSTTWMHSKAQRTTSFRSQNALSGPRKWSLVALFKRLSERKTAVNARQRAAEMSPCLAQ